MPMQLTTAFRSRSDRGRQSRAVAAQLVCFARPPGHFLVRAFAILLAVASCGGDGRANIDAAPPVDAAVDAVAATLDCTSYCGAIQANCTGANTQYKDTAHCLAACTSFATATSTVNDTSGNTLGCRIHYAFDASNPAVAEADCSHAGPAGDLLTAAVPAFCSGGNVCASFCALEVQACGSVQAPLPGDPIDVLNNPLFQYQTVAGCINACAAFDKTHAYSPPARGDSLACRLAQTIDAVMAVNPNAVMDCADTGAPPNGLCTGPASP